MFALDPYLCETNVVQDTPPHDTFTISYLPSIISDITGCVPQLDSQNSAKSFMQEQFRTASLNMNDSGIVINDWA